MPIHAKPGVRPATDVFDAIAHPLRRQILETLGRGEHGAGELAEPATVTRSAVSQHLRVLLELGLIAERREGRRRLYRLRAEPLRGARDWLEQFDVFWETRLSQLADHLETHP